jgi:hypothetical protein
MSAMSAALPAWVLGLLRRLAGDASALPRRRPSTLRPDDLSAHLRADLGVGQDRDRA